MPSSSSRWTTRSDRRRQRACVAERAVGTATGPAVAARVPARHKPAPVDARGLVEPEAVILAERVQRAAAVHVAEAVAGELVARRTRRLEIRTAEFLPQRRLVTPLVVEAIRIEQAAVIDLPVGVALVERTGGAAQPLDAAHAGVAGVRIVRARRRFPVEQTTALLGPTGAAAERTLTAELTERVLAVVRSPDQWCRAKDEQGSFLGIAVPHRQQASVTLAPLHTSARVRCAGAGKQAGRSTALTARPPRP